MKIRDYFKKEINEDFLNWWKYKEITDKMTQSKKWQKELQKEAKRGNVSKKLLDKVAKDVLEKPEYNLYKREYNDITEFIASGLGIDVEDIEKE